MGTINQIIEVSVRYVYGKKVVDVISEHREAIRALTGCKTLTDAHIIALQKLGFQFNVNHENHNI